MSDKPAEWGEWLVWACQECNAVHFEMDHLTEEGAEHFETGMAPQTAFEFGKAIVERAMAMGAKDE